MPVPAGYVLETPTSLPKGYVLEDAAAAELPEGVAVVGRNTAGGAIYGPAGAPAPSGGAARRFLTSAVDAIKQPIAGAYHAFVDAPQTPEEMGTEAGGGRFALVTKRMLVDPHLAEARKAAAEFKQGNWLSLHPTPEQQTHQALALGHGLATAIPLIGPAAAQTAEQVGTQAGTGDVAGALGTAAGNVALYAAPEALGKVARSEFITRSIPKGIVTRMIRPAAQDLKFGKDPAAAILDEGIVGNKLEDIGERVYERLGEVGRQLDAEALKPANARKVVDVSKSLKPLDDAMAEATKAGDRKLFSKLLEIKTELTSNWKPFRDASGNYSLRATGPRSLRMSPYEALRFKRQIGDRIRWADDPLDGATNQALGSAYNEVRDDVNAAVPGLKELNQRYSNLVGALKAVERRIPVEARAAHWSLGDIALGASGHLPLAVARHVARYPAIRTRGARFLYRLPERVPEHPTAVTAPAVAASQSTAQRLRQLQAEAERRRP